MVWWEGLLAIGLLEVESPPRGRAPSEASIGLLEVELLGAGLLEVESLGAGLLNR